MSVDHRSEPTTALDVTTQAQILKLIRELQAQDRDGRIVLAHDFGVVAEIADRVAVMQNGNLVEDGPVDEVINAPKHPYTASLLAAVPKLRPPPRAAVAPSGDVILSVEHLAKAYRSAAVFIMRSMPTPGMVDVSHLARAGREPWHRRRERVGQVDARALHRAPDAAGRRLDAATRLEYADLSGSAMRRQIRRIQMVFQDTSGSLNPRESRRSDRSRA